MPATPDQGVLHALQLAGEGRFDEIRDLFAPQLQALVAPEALRAGWDAELARQGAVVSVGEPVTEPGANGTVVRIPVTCERGAFALIASVGPAGQLGSLQLAPIAAASPVAPWEPPPYSDPGVFDEQEVTLGHGAFAVPATLTLPRQQPPLAAVVLLAGSGPLDRDETIGRNKPFRDIAWGLATRGIVTLRFDKVTYAHAGAVARSDEFTLTDEYVPHAIAAIELLRDHPAVDSRRIFVLGHSLGGTAAPRVAAADPSIAGMVLLAGGAAPLHWTIVRQMEYLASLSPGAGDAAQQAIDVVREQARFVDSSELSPSTPRGRLPLGTTASYWLDLRSYDAPQLASEAGRPMLILQGGRDYQATLDDDLARWRAALDGHQNVTFHVYPEHNHLFTPGSGAATPAEYEPAQHVDGAVVSQIADWIQNAPPSTA